MINREGTRRNAKKKRRREEGEKISLRFPQTVEAASFFSVHIDCKRIFLAG
jgi:hypothetical protein